MLQPAGSLRPINPGSVKVNAYPLSTLVLNVNTGCNLSCTYCYKEDLAKPKDGRKMDFATAARSVDLLLEAGAARERVNIVFFGGEPLSNVALIKQVVGYAEAEPAEAHRAFQRLGEDYPPAAPRGLNNGLSNMHHLMTDLHEGRRKSLPCGAGVGLLAVDGDGELNLCHRFTGSDLPTFGNVPSGIDGERLGAFIDKAIDRQSTHCETC